ncbi:hypothetical protein ATCVBr0604L_810L [Acanthocystis turfacea Chlorella virus Br0604L]|nr:hypothetical protein ATCVBr0604L_810L [Acanthocystis turfacea Chlorella virus Br0604L]
MCDSGNLLCSVWHQGQMTTNYMYFLLSCLLKPVKHGFFNLYYFMLSNMSTYARIPPLDTIYEEPEEMSLDAMVNSAPNSSSVNAYILSKDIDDEEITSRFVKSLSPASSCGSNSPFGSTIDMSVDDEVCSRLVPSVSNKQIT